MSFTNYVVCAEHLTLIESGTKLIKTLSLIYTKRDMAQPIHEFANKKDNVMGRSLP